MAMVKGYAQSLLIITAFSLFISCSTGRADYESALLEWTGKEIVIPDSLPLVGGGWYVNEPANFTIVAYYDSEGCTGCRMKLPFWKEFMDRVDSVSVSKRVRFMLIAATDDEKELEYLMKRDGFTRDVIVDSISSFSKANVLPDDPHLQAFLLDGENRVVLIGNPIDMRSIGKVYLNSVKGGDGSGQEEKSEDIEEHSHSFGKVRKGETVAHTFYLTNQTADTLRVKDIVSSCDCTVGEISSRVIPPSMRYEMTVRFSDTIPGEFFRVVRLNFEDNHREVEFDLTGEIINF